MYPILGVILLLLACGDRAASIPNTVSDEEYSVYSAWLNHRFQEQPPGLLLANRTFVFDPLAPGELCNAQKLRAQAPASSFLFRALHDLGQAQYPVRTGKFSQAGFKIPWKYGESGGLSANHSPPFLLISFSRVAFNRDRSEALLAVDEVCGGLCGQGGALFAVRRQGKWVFRPAGCAWVS